MFFYSQFQGNLEITYPSHSFPPQCIMFNEAFHNPQNDSTYALNTLLHTQCSHRCLQLARHELNHKLHIPRAPSKHFDVVLTLWKSTVTNAISTVVRFVFTRKFHSSE